jgi:16S rRNA (adenine1518-N6/adenine1519-N6)-dimethyltransferase
VVINAKKSLGQNFLVDKTILEKIAEITEIENKEVLEVGPGTGNLTDYILKKNPKKFYVVEKDDKLALLLNEKFNDKINIINDDILNLSVDKISEEKFIVFGNLPYNISTEILSRWIINLKKDFWFTKLILMFQKEVAERIIAEVNTSNYGRLSILSKWKLSVKKIIDIKPNSFLPRPKIDSSLLVFSPKENFLEIKNPKNLEMITKTFFSQRRKMIKKPFNQIFNNTKEVAKKLNIDLNLRPQNLSPETYLNITKEYENLRS